ncbi:putative defense protein 3 [Cherax quadricarinatus]|uniref:putative defense protein 3 n=1 Tax=Cherax quadricarinatus TaxID=27406 RepID=UPI002378B423|nr:putative defense protein 3 [Cherax quadricarinatus]
MDWVALWVAGVWAAAMMMGGGEAFSSVSVAVACDTMQPGHLSLGAQTVPSPFHIHITSKDDYYYVTLYGEKNREFKGFMLQARDSKGERVGRFIKVQKPGRIIDCSTNDGAAVQHKNSDPKTQVTASWVPEDFKGQVQFRATVVESYTTYWVNLLSDPLTV